MPRIRPATALLFCLPGGQPASAQDAPAPAAPPPATAPDDKGMTTLTVFLRHDESQTLDEIDARLRVCE